MKRSLLPFTLWLAAALAPHLSAETFYVGTYTKPGGSEGIYRYDLNPETGAVTDQGLAVPAKSPAFLTLHPSKKYLYAVNEDAGGGASAYAVQPDGSLKELNRQPTLGDGPTHLCIDKEGKNILVANYGGGSVAVLPIQADGSLGKASGFMQHKGSSADPKRQKGPHAHGVYVDGLNSRALVPDLGLDKVMLYQFDPAKGSLAPAEPPFLSTAPGSGPRHLALDAQGRVYVTTEMANTVTVFADAKQGYRELQTISTLPEGYTGKSYTSEILLHPKGHTLYVSNRGHNSTAIFKVGDDGRLTAAGHTPTGGDHPRFIGLNPSGKFFFAANMNTDNVLVFRIGEKGELTPTGTEFKRAKPVCILFMD